MRRRCLWCQEPPLHEIAVLKWRDDERERLTVLLCGKHLKRLQDAGAKGREDVMAPFSITTISPGSISRTKSAPMMSRAQVSDERA